MEYEDIVNVCSIEVPPGYDEEANGTLKRGWVLLAVQVVQRGPGNPLPVSVVYVFGRKRSSFDDMLELCEAR